MRLPTLTKGINMSSLTLSFNEVNLSPVARNDGQIWLTSTDLAKALDYKSSDSITRIFNRNKDEFSQGMTHTIETVNLTASSKTKGLRAKIRIFSLRGCHLLAMFARTDIAKQFRKWVLDILDKEVGAPVQVNPIATISAAQQHAIRRAVAKKCKSVSAHYQTIYTKLYEHFNIPRYTELLAVDFDDAICFIDSVDLNSQSDINAMADKENSYALSFHMMYCKHWFDSVRAPLEALNPEVTRLIAGHFEEGMGAAKQLNRSICNM